MLFVVVVFFFPFSPQIILKSFSLLGMTLKRMTQKLETAGSYLGSLLVSL